jgi:hypothetical protein
MVNSKLSVVDFKDDKSASGTSMDPPWFPSPLLTLWMQGTTEATTSRMTSLAPPMDPTWFPSPLLTLGMQGTGDARWAKAVLLASAHLSPFSSG